MYGKDDIDKITDYVETKSRDEVVKYSDVFYNGKHDSFP
jgi:predicted GTPase